MVQDERQLFLFACELVVRLAAALGGFDVAVSVNGGCLTCSEHAWLALGLCVSGLAQPFCYWRCLQ